MISPAMRAFLTDLDAVLKKHKAYLEADRDGELSACIDSGDPLDDYQVLNAPGSRWANPTIEQILSQS